MTLANLPAPLHLPWSDVRWVTEASYTISSLTINDDTDEIAFIVEIPATGTLSQLYFYTGTITTGENGIPVRLETVGTDGNPSGTLIDSPTNAATGTVDIANTDDSVIKTVSINSGSGVTVSYGQIVAIRIKRNTSGSLSGALFSYSSSPGSPGISGVRDYNIGGAGVWTKTTAKPLLSVLINSVWYPIARCTGGGVKAGSVDNIASPKERGMLINVPVAMRAIGAIINGTFAAGSSFVLSLYEDPTGTPVLRASTPVTDTDSVQSASSRGVSRLFAVPFNLMPNTDYVIVLTPQDATALGINYLTCNATYANSNPAGPRGTFFGRDNSASGAFSETNTRIPLICLIVDQVDTIKPRGVYGSGEATKESGANARGGSGACLKMNPGSTTLPLAYEFLIPVTAATEFTLSFWHKISTDYNGSVKVTIYDSDDDATILLNAETVSLTNDGSYHQYTSTGCTPTDTGFCRCVINVLDGATTGDVYIDDMTVAAV
jgi:hypothetical protein